MAVNNRIYYAIQQVGLKADGNEGAFTAIKGVQSVGMTTNFNLEQVFELGQLAIYENIENIPDVEVTLNKVLDGNALIYHLATRNSPTPTLAGKSTEKSVFGLSIFQDTATEADGAPDSMCQASGMFVNSISYNFPADDNFNEDITLVGNDKVWLDDPNITAGNPAESAITTEFSGAFPGGDDSPVASGGGVNRRENLQFEADTATFTGGDGNGMHTDPDACVFPPDVFGINGYGENSLDGATDQYGAHISNITISTDLGREEINELGRKAPYVRNVTFPIEVTCEIEVVSSSGDMVSATEYGIRTPAGADNCTDSGNLQDRSIRIAACEGTRISLGQKNKLASVNYSGGDAGGGNVTVSYTFTTFNDMTVMHPQDPAGSYSYGDRSDYLVFGSATLNPA